VLRGYIDEVGMYESVLPLSLIKDYATQTPLPTMTALMAYLDFSHDVKQQNDTHRLMPTGISLKQYVDAQGKVLARRDTLVQQNLVDELADRTTYAPMTSASQLKALNYSYVARENELNINIKEPDFMVEKTNLYITVKEVPDLQGNLMASPVMMNLYVYRNPLRWSENQITADLNYGEGGVLAATISNESGIDQYFELRDLPVWITASQTNGTIEALGKRKILFTVSDYINVGTYHELISLVGGNNMTEPLTLSFRVSGNAPQWQVDNKLKKDNQTMMMVARVKIDGVVDTAMDDIIGVFDENLTTLGVANIETDNTANANEARAYITIYGYTNADGTTPRLLFRLYDASTGNVVSLNAEDGQEYSFVKDAVVGSPANPVMLENTYNYVQTISLKKGWNWVSLGVKPLPGATIGSYLNSAAVWEPGDIIATVEGTKALQWTCRQNAKAPRGYLWDHNDDPISLDPTKMYTIYSVSDKDVTLEGSFAYNKITVHKDWNRIAYLSGINLPIAQALSDYSEKASEGDVIKSQTAFSVATKTASGLVWKGTLQHMEKGKGYMLKRMAGDEASFEYPQYFSDNRYSGTATAARQRDGRNTLATMNVVARVSGIELLPGDRLAVYGGAERLAETTADDEGLFYLNIGSDGQPAGTLTFAVEREGCIVAAAGSALTFQPNRVAGTPNAPTAIDFVAPDKLPTDGRWYTTAGLLLPKKPTKTGLYIHDGKVIQISNN